jgi:hypothetical protein
MTKIAFQLGLTDLLGDTDLLGALLDDNTVVGIT